MTPTPEQVEAWAREAGIDLHSDTLCRHEGWAEPMQKFAALVCLWAREAGVQSPEEYHGDKSADSPWMAKTADLAKFAALACAWQREQLSKPADKALEPRPCDQCSGTMTAHSNGYSTFLRCGRCGAVPMDWAKAIRSDCADGAKGG